jgi:probable rRNA maturation factor
MRKKKKQRPVAAGEIEIRNLTRGQLPSRFILKTAKKIKYFAGLKRSVWFELTLLGEAKMAHINRKWRKKDKATNILSFGAREAFPGLPDFLGEIFLCPEIIKKESKRLGLSFEKELTRLLIHGILHLVGYSHKSPRESILMERRSRMIERKIFYGNKKHIRT